MGGGLGVTTTGGCQDRFLEQAAFTQRPLRRYVAFLHFVHFLIACTEPSCNLNLKCVQILMIEQLQLQLQLQGLHGAFCNVNKRIFNFSCVLQAWWKYVDNESY